MEDALRALETRRAIEHAILDALDGGVIVLDADATVIAANRAAHAILGVETLVGTGPPFGDDRRMGTEDGVALTARESPALDALRGGVARDRVLLRRTEPDGGTTWLRANYRPLRRSSEDRPWGLVFSFRDVTAVKEAEHALRHERDRAQQLLDLAGNVIVVLDAAGRIDVLNRAGHHMLGFGEGELVGREWFAECVPPDRLDETRATFGRLMAGGDLAESDVVYENEVVTRDGRRRILTWHNTVLRDDAGAPVGTLSAGVDVTERREAERQVAHLAYHDRLTGLPNRTLLEEHLRRALARARRNGTSVALLFLDLDDFKLVNDSLGHAAGDDVLCEAARRLAGITRTSDLLVRQGSDEFLLLMTDLAEDAVQVATRAAGRVADVFGPPFMLGGAEFGVGASVGIAISPHDALTPDGLLKAADAAMYVAKRDERAGHWFFAPRRDDARDRLSMMTGLRRALGAGELALHFQPVCFVEGGGPAGAEALLRWGDVPPSVFIPLAEDMGLIHALGDWVMSEVCAQAARWRATGWAWPVSFNVSPHQLRRGGLPERVLAAVGEHGLRPEDVVVEVTESAAMEGKRSEEQVRALSEAGVRVSIDDFGAGHSSLSRLRELPAEMLKIDRSFLASVPGDRQGRAIVSAIATLADGLGMTTVAEGVERPEQLAFLAEVGVELAQGYLFGRPVPAADFARFLPTT